MTVGETVLEYEIAGLDNVINTYANIVGKCMSPLIEKDRRDEFKEETLSKYEEFREALFVFKRAHDKFFQHCRKLVK